MPENCQSCAGGQYTGISVFGIYDDTTGCPLITVSGSPAVASINVGVINIPEVTINGVGTTCTGGVSPTLSHLGTAGQYALLAYSGVSNAGSSVISGGNVGSFPTDPGAGASGFPPGTFVAPAAYVAATSANQTDLAAAITYYQGLGPGTVLTTADMGTQNSIGAPVGTYYPGVYSSGSSLAIDTPITLDAQGNPDAVFVFLAGSTITQQIAGTILLANGAQACNIVWVAGSSWTSIGPGATTIGTILAVASVTLGGGTLVGRALANTGAVTIATAEIVTTPDCATTQVCGLNTFVTGGEICVTQCTSPWVVNLTEVGGVPIGTTIAGSPASASLNVFVTGGDVTLTSNTPSTPIYVDVVNFQPCVSVCGASFSEVGSPAVSSLNVFSQGGTVCATQCGTWTVDIGNTVTVTGTGAGGAITVTGPGGAPVDVNITNACINVCGQTFTEVGSPAVSSLNTFVTGGSVTLTSNTPDTPIYVDVTNFSACVDICGASFSTFGSPAESFLNVNVANTVDTPIFVDVTGGSISITGTVDVSGSTVTVENTPTTPIFVCPGDCLVPFNINLTDINGVPVGFTTTGSPATAALDVFVVNSQSTIVEATVICGPQTFTLGESAPLSIAPSGALVTIPADEQFACSIQYYSYDSGAAFDTQVMTTAFVPLWSIQGNGIGTIVQLLREIQVFTDGSAVLFELIEGGALTGAAFTAGPGNVNVDTSATVVTGGTVVWSGYAAAFPRNFDGLMDCLNGKTYTIAGKSFKGCAKAVAQIRWSEQTSICG
jgi:hypothetical protein